MVEIIHQIYPKIQQATPDLPDRRLTFTLSQEGSPVLCQFQLDVQQQGNEITVPGFTLPKGVLP